MPSLSVSVHVVNKGFEGFDNRILLKTVVVTPDTANLYDELTP